MGELVRVSESQEHFDDDCASPVWSAVEDAVNRQFKVHPFQQMTAIDDPQFRYIPSRARRERFEIIAGHKRFKTEIELTNASPQQADLGPVERDVLRFIHLTGPDLGLLVGGMGGGKSTTLRYLLKHHKKELKVVYCDFDKSVDISVESPTWAARILTQRIASSITQLIEPTEEFTKVWTWAFSLEDSAEHHARVVLSDALVILRRELEGNWRDESARAIAIRKACHEVLVKDPQEQLKYFALLIDYFLSVTCGGDRGRLVLVIDNVDPLPPRLQYELLRLASRLQESAQCKVLIAMRPMTYTRNLQAANRDMEVIEHVGPAALDLIEARVIDLIDRADLSELRVRVADENGSEFEIGEAEIKQWIRLVIAAARSSGPASSSEITPRMFIEGVCNNSLRSALIVAPKLFTSEVVPFVLPEHPRFSSRPTHQVRVRSHDLVRAVLLGRKPCFRSHSGRVVDNIFDLGRNSGAQSITCKIRLLKRLDSAANGILQIEQLRDHVQAFGLSDDVVLDGINAVIAQTKRLAWSDTVVLYESFADLPASRIQIADSGRFYINHAILNLEYVQETHLDIPLPRGTLLSDYQPSRFADRIASLFQFLRHLHDIDRAEVAKILAAQRGREYVTAYGPALISTTMTIAIARQVQNVGRSMQGRGGSRVHRDNEHALQQWIDVENLFEHEDRDLIKKLRSFAS